MSDSAARHCPLETIDRYTIIWRNKERKTLEMFNEEELTSAETG